MKMKLKFTNGPTAVASALVLALGLTCAPVPGTLADTSTNAPAASAGTIRYDSVPGGSSCEVAGDSTLHEWKMNTGQLVGTLEADEAFPESALTNPAATKPPVRIRVPLRTLKSDKASMDKARETLTQASHKLAEQMYKSAQAQTPPTPGAAFGPAFRGRASPKAQTVCAKAARYCCRRRQSCRDCL